LAWTVRYLATTAGIHHNTVNSFETERYAGRPETIAAMRKALEKAGVEFTNGKRPGVRLGRV
jgi:predicted nucleic acid-binding Zn ribbon protein